MPSWIQYWFILYVVFVSAYPLLGRFPFSRPIPDFYAKIPAFYANIPCYLGFYAWYRAWCAVRGARWRWGVGRRGEGPCVARRCLHPRTWCYPDVQFNLPSRFLIPGPSPAPVLAGDWWVVPWNGDCNAFVYPPPYLRKEFYLFLCHDSTQSRDHG